MAPLLGDAREVARAIVTGLRAIGDMAHPAYLDGLADRIAEHRPEAGFEDTSTERHVDMRTAMISLDRLLPADRVVVVDGGRFTPAPLKYLNVTTPSSVISAVSFGAIGLGIATAIGAAIGAAGRVTVGVIGDGGGMMALTELVTAVRLRLRLVIVVLNDGAYGAEYTKLAQYGVDPDYSLLEWPEFAGVARALGLAGMTVRTKHELDALGPALDAVDAPLLIDIKADPTVDISAERQVSRAG
jgi:thiamine pyrophosphate-dependent acetolactate synthase large subunit-like protein